MRYLFTIFLLVSISGCGSEPVRFSKKNNAKSAEGWSGVRYFENGTVKSEEWDAVGGDGKADVWRYYDAGVRFSEERDLNGDGKINFEAKWNALTGELREYSLDADSSGVVDVAVKWLNGYKWRQSMDTDHDGVVDMIFTFKGPSRLLTQLGVDPVKGEDLRGVVDKKLWLEVAVDTNHDHLIETWVRYDDCEVSARGTDSNGDGRVDNWVRETGSGDGKYTGISNIRPMEESSESEPQPLSSRKADNGRGATLPTPENDGGSDSSTVDTEGDTPPIGIEDQPDASSDDEVVDEVSEGANAENGEPHKKSPWYKIFHRNNKDSDAIQNKDVGEELINGNNKPKAKATARVAPSSGGDE